MADSITKRRTVKHVWAKDGRLIKEIIEAAPIQGDLPEDDLFPFSDGDEFEDWAGASREARRDLVFDLMN